jgi:hypothetical protein
MLVMSQTEFGFSAGYNTFAVTEGQNGSVDKVNYTNLHDTYVLSFVARQRSEHAFNLAIDVDYLHQSFKVDAGSYSPGSSESDKLMFIVGRINIQVLPQFVYGKKFKIYWYPGFYFGRIVTSSVSGSEYTWQLDQSVGTTNSVSGSACQYIPMYDFGLVLGMGLDIPLHKELSLLVEYSNSFSIYGISWGEANTHFLNLNFKVGVAYTIKSPKHQKDKK